jgi:hypothetical protein
MNRPDPPEKAPYGSPCSSCGRCCEDQLCTLGQKVFRHKEGPCPALEYGPDGRSACGLIKRPQHYAKARALRCGKTMLQQSAEVVCGAGLGCDAIYEGEMIAPETRAMMHAKYDALPRPAWTAAKRAWGMA